MPITFTGQLGHITSLKNSATIDRRFSPSTPKMILIVEDSADISGALNLLFDNAILPCYP